MLVLSRQRDETIMIGDDVEITVVDIRGDKVRLGINAPRHIQVHRKEVYDAIKRENQQAATLRPRDVSEAVRRDAEKNKPEKESRDIDGRESDRKSRDGQVSNSQTDSSDEKPVVDPPRSNHAGRSQ